MFLTRLANFGGYDGSYWGNCCLAQTNRIQQRSLFRRANGCEIEIHATAESTGRTIHDAFMLERQENVENGEHGLWSIGEWQSAVLIGHFLQSLFHKFIFFHQI